MLNLDWGMGIGESVEFGRVHDQLYPTMVDVDSTYPGPLVDALRQRGHNVTGLSSFESLVRPSVRVDDKLVLDINRVAAAVQAVVRDDDITWGKCIQANIVFRKLITMFNYKRRAIQGRMALRPGIDGSHP